MHSLEASIFKYITVAAYRIYAQLDEDVAIVEVGSHALNSRGNYIFDYEISWKNHGIVFSSFCGNTGAVTW